MSKHRRELEDETKEMYMHGTKMETEWKHDKKGIKTRCEKGQKTKERHTCMLELCMVEL